MCILQWQGTFFSVLLPALDCCFQGQFGAQVKWAWYKGKRRLHRPSSARLTWCGFVGSYRSMAVILVVLVLIMLMV